MNNSDFLSQHELLILSHKAPRRKAPGRNRPHNRNENRDLQNSHTDSRLVFPVNDKMSKKREKL